MRIVIDAYGGDNAPLEIIKGAVQARKEFDAEIVLTGSEQGIRDCAQQNGIDLAGIGIADAPQVMEMEDDARAVLRAKKNSSMSVALRMLAEGAADAMISAGPTGALLMGATMLVKRLPGVKRPALGTLVPSFSGGRYMLIDCGANAVCRPEMLQQFAIMGSVYMKTAAGVENPRVGLANNGAEESKGTELQQQAYALLKQTPEINFVGNVEGRGIPCAECDVVVCDGFTGNLILKTIEGCGKSISVKFKEMFGRSLITKLAALLMLGEIKNFKRAMDYKEVGGAPFIGLRKPVIKAHGSSDARALCAAVRQAISWAQSGTSEQISACFAGKEVGEDDPV